MSQYLMAVYYWAAVAALGALVPYSVVAFRSIAHRIEARIREVEPPHSAPMPSSCG